MDTELHQTQGIRLAVEGCGHGTLHAIYASVAEACKRKHWPDVDLLIIGGDFQAVRNAYDLNCVSMPPKYREMADFHEYYSGQRVAPYLTVFVGGNHEASNHLFELYYGGWVAPNIYYMGAANVLRLGPLRIAGLSGIWKGYDYRKPHFERLPYNENDLKSIYHVRERDVRKLLQVRSQVDIGISHDWPKGVEWKGDWKQLFRFKPHLEQDARNGQLGSVAAKYAMDWLRPKLWFSAHLHCKYAAIPPPQIDNATTHFLALDKCLPGRHFLQLMEVPCEGEVDSLRPLKLTYDREWLAITRTFAMDGPSPIADADVPEKDRTNSILEDYGEMIDKRRLWVDEHVSDADLVVPENFEITAPVYDGGNWNLPQYADGREHPNPQTARFCKMLDIPNAFEITDEEIDRRMRSGPRIDPVSERSNGGRGQGGSHQGRYRGGGRNRGGRGRGRGRAW
ncbi:lariat debranching enzyme, C-terminal domain-containing protein [Neohortaea acidophila]|uniref:Lariat debranching enzyme, C-terminal domain-containing protein n=1 Tax=Neohortaea acidophila TaxID=245834 RepID=A0A6A6PSA8_9PEZI|nr:lariat debranching enzyme, C-terminal domain-containing protein [Neohortaea acidophila]KAF2482990.1 lariat debranching enzyme, C-terminal domain-containing protein [Neohortaea acidophila]